MYISGVSVLRKTIFTLMTRRAVLALRSRTVLPDIDCLRRSQVISKEAMHI